MGLGATGWCAPDDIMIAEGLGNKTVQQVAQDHGAASIRRRWPVSKRINSSRTPDDDPLLIENIELSETAN
jgi:hypothetical protein